MNYRVRFFQIKEFRCPCCGRVMIAAGLVFLLDVFRASLGRRLVVTSGYRCQAHNAEVGGAESSRHLVGCAADLRPVAGMSYADFAAAVGGVFAWPECEVKTYPAETHVHVAIPRNAAGVTWSGGDLHVCPASPHFRG